MRIHLALTARGGAPLTRVQSGFSLVELMVSLTIGLIVSLAVMMGYLGAAQTQRGQSDVSRMQEAARFAFDLYGRETRNAAFRYNLSAGNVTQAFAGTDAGSGFPSYIQGINDATTPTLPDSSTPTVINHGDTITFRFYGMDGNTAGTADGTMLNCTGTGVKAGQLNEDTLYIARDLTNTAFDAAGEPTLYCVSRQTAVNSTTYGASTIVPLIPGVESMQILYGEDTDGVVDSNNADGIANHYVPPAALSKSDFSLVRSLMVSLVVRSPSTSGFTAAGQFNHFGTDYAPGNAAPANDVGSVFCSTIGAPSGPCSGNADGRLRRIYNSYFAVRNVL